MKILLIVSMLIANIAMAATNTNVVVNFNQADKFTDFKTRAISTKSERKKLKQQLSDLIISAVTKHLKSGQSMELTINNIDMAGTFLLGNSDLYRIVRDYDRIRIEFSYKLSKDGNIVKQDDVNLTSMDSRATRIVNKYKHTRFSYEMPLIDNWLKQNF